MKAPVAQRKARRTPNPKVAGSNPAGSASVRTAEVSQPFYVHCSDCDHAWIGGQLPMDVEEFAKALKSQSCPNGCKSNVYMGQSPKTFRPVAR